MHKNKDVITKIRDFKQQEQLKEDLFVCLNETETAHTYPGGPSEIPALGLTGFQSSLQQEVLMLQSTAHKHNSNISQATNTGIAAVDMEDVIP